jgi:type IV fimbrial biogenesis protein FimT
MKIKLALHGAPQSEGGFTLIELMVTVTIAAVLLAIGVPGMTDLIRDARLATQSDMLVSTLNLARMEALKQGKSFKVCPAETPSTASGCTVNLQTWATGWIVFGDAAVSHRTETKNGLTITAAFDDVTFNSTLGSASAARSFTLCVSGRKEHVVAVDLSGHVSKKIGTTVCT